MPELRRDPVTREWVIVSNERAKRPNDFVRENGDKELPDFDSSCPFCPGAEAETTTEVLAYRTEGHPDSPGWTVRVVPNKYPALIPQGSLDSQGYGMYDMLNGVGVHEVIIEAPQHNLSVATMAVKQLSDVLWAYRDRCLDLSQDTRIRYTMLFRNKGTIAGATLDHPHSQLIALPMVPHGVQLKLTGMEAFRSYHERCVYCDMIRQEMNFGQRMVAENPDFVAFTPFAPKWPFELMIVPRGHRRLFMQETRSSLTSLAKILQEVVQRLNVCLDNPPYNFTLHTAPVNVHPEPDFHWHLSVMPRLAIAAGFEMGTGIYINTMTPEDAAGFLRDVSLTNQIPPSAQLKAAPEDEVEEHIQERKAV